MPSINSVPSSRFRDTSLYRSRDVGLYFYGPYVPPVEFEQKYFESTVTHLVAIHEIGFLDKIAVKYYGAGNEALWWVICRINGIVDVEVDVWPGRKLTIPTLEVVNHFLRGRSGTVS